MSSTDHRTGTSPSDLADTIEQVTDIGARFRLDGRRYVVLGGGRGMGRQTSHSLAQLGAEVIVVDSDQERADAVAKEIGSTLGGRTVDATSADQMRELAEGAGEVDGVVDVIGMARYEPLTEMSDQTWLDEHDIVLRHAWLTVRYFAPAMRTRGAGSLTFVASVSGLTSAPGHGAYGVFKAGLVSLVRTAAMELGPDNVRVNAVAPGFVLTPRLLHGLDDEQFARGQSVAALPRVILPADIAAGLTFLASDLAAAITGQTLVVDGGATSAFPYQMRGFSSDTGYSLP